MDLKRFFNPRSIAIVGVSSNPKKVGFLVAKNMIAQGFSGDLCFINIEGKEILGKKTFKNLKETGKKFDLIVICIPAPLAVSFLDEVAENGCQNVIIFAAGFGETHTEEGRKLQIVLDEKVTEHKLNILGPNCIGYINTKINVNATFFQCSAPKGKIGIITQSGALGTAFLDYVVAKSQIGISHLISLGNKTVINESDCIEYLIKDEETKVIAIYLEDVKNGERFIDVLQKATATKPVIILKSGRTIAGSTAAISHTGSIASDDDVFSSIMRKTGVIRAENYGQLEMLLKLYNFEAIPSNNRVLVLSNAGGMGVLLTDELIKAGLELVTVGQEVTNSLNKAFDQVKKISVHNPIDLLGDASAFDYQKAIELTMKEKDVGAIIVLLTPQANTEILETAKVLENIHHQLKFMPLYPIFMGKDSVTEAHRYFESHGISSFRYSSDLPLALAKIIEAEKLRLNPKTMHFDFSNIVSKNESMLNTGAMIAERDTPSSFLNQYDSLTIISKASIKVIKTYLADSLKDLDRIVKQEGFPLVLKTADPKITHKTEVKGVVTGITVYEELINAFNTFSQKPCYVQKQCEGVELIVGSKRDPVFGVVVIVGFGGIFTELLNEVAEFVYPFSIYEFNEALAKTKLLKLTQGFRNMPKIDLSQLYDVCLKVGALMDKTPQIKEIDINPLICSQDGLIAVDGRVIV
jgi:acetyltransferase